MVLSLESSASSPRARRSYVRAPSPLHFPVEKRVPESSWHLEARYALYESVKRELEGRALVGSDQFLYWDPTDPKKCLAPDLAVRLGPPGEPLLSWKTWERGAPAVGVEIVSGSDASEAVFSKKLERYRQAGVSEVVRFDAEDGEQPLRLWDLFDGDLVERKLEGPEATRCDALGLHWCVRESEHGRVLRLSRDADGKELVLTQTEIAEAERMAKEAERRAKEAALRRIAELETEAAQRTKG